MLCLCFFVFFSSRRRHTRYWRDWSSDVCSSDLWRTVETMVGPVELERPYFYCRACRAGLYPLDDALGLVAGCRQPAMHQAAAKLVTEVPYDTAQALFGDLTGMHFGSERMHTMTNQVGVGLTVLDVTPSRQEIERRIASVSAGRL